MEDESKQGDSAILAEIIAALQRVPADTRGRLLRTVATFFESDIPSHGVTTPQPSPQARMDFSAEPSITPKVFLLEKQPRTDVERIACLAYYLTHHRGEPDFKTLDLTKLNTEAAQPKFTNAAYASNNATKMGYLAPSTKGHRQLSAAGELFVRALPDREAARAVMTSALKRRRARRRQSVPAKGELGE